METIGIVLMLFLLSAALWGVHVAIAIIFGRRHATVWLRVLVTLVIAYLMTWMLASPSFGDLMQRSLKLLGIGLIIMIGDGIARVTRWIDDHTGYPPPVRSAPKQTRTGVNLASRRARLVV
jgi:hypothetical protein